jgi:hypothetical protein
MHSSVDVENIYRVRFDEGYLRADDKTDMDLDEVMLLKRMSSRHKKGGEGVSVLLVRA